MKLILVGCEYAGKTTLANAIVEWTDHTAGKGRGFHDHFTIPNEELSPESREHLMAAPPQLKEMFQRFMIAHHLSRDFYGGPDQNFIGYHIEEAVYAPMYYGYGGTDSGAVFRSGEGQRTKMARAVERELIKIAPESVLVLVKASLDAIARRMSENPHEHQVVQKDDIPEVLRRFEDEYSWSLIQKKFVLDTTNSTPEETLEQFVERFESYFTEADRSATWSKDRQEQIDAAWASYL